MNQTIEEKNKALVFKAFDTLFNSKRQANTTRTDQAAWSLASRS